MPVLAGRLVFNFQWEAMQKSSDSSHSFIGLFLYYLLRMAYVLLAPNQNDFTKKTVAVDLLREKLMTWMTGIGETVLINAVICC